MRLLENHLRYSATDVANFLACRHLTRLDLAAAHGLVDPPFQQDLGIEALSRRGDAHEARVLAEFEAQEWKVEQIPKEGVDFQARAELTELALDSGVDIIYQGVLRRGNRLGLPDFLIRSDLLEEESGGTGYEVCDAKLARSAKAKAVLQSIFYSRLLYEVAGIEPRNIHLELGNGERATFRVKDYAAYERQVDRLLQEFIVEEPTFPPNDTYPEPVEHCAVCRWRSACVQRRRQDDDLSLVAGMASKQRKGLKDIGILTRRDFAALDEPPKIKRVGSKALGKSHAQARIQVRGEDEGRPLWEFVDPERDRDGELVPDRGLLALPEPSPGDLFFDIEGARYYSEDSNEFGLQYLFGIVDSADLDENGNPRYHAFWAFDRSEERAAFEMVVDFIAERLERNPDAHVYHYNHYEPTAIDHLAELHLTREDVVRRLMGRFATKEEEVDNLLRQRTFVDLYRVVRQGLRASVKSYSIKRLEPFYGLERAIELAKVNERVVAFDLALDLGEAEEDVETRRIIQGYNEDDCRSTLQLRSWLEARRADLVQHLRVDLPRPPSPEVPEDQTDPEVKRLKEALFDGLPEAGRSDVEEAGALLADLLEFHRRDDKPKWWRYFHLKDLTADELMDEPDAIAGLEFVGTGDQVKKSTLYVYRYPPQEHGFRDGDVVEDPGTGKPWTIHEIDDASGILSIPRGPKRQDEPHPEVLIESAPQYRKKTHALSLRDLADKVLAREGNEWPRSAEFDLLLRRRPNDGEPNGAALRRTDEDALAAGRRLAVSMADTYLPVQGPPGTGKTYMAACQVLDLFRHGKKVGVTANSHAVICNLLDEVAQVSDAEGVQIRIGQKPDENRRWANQRAIDAGLLFRSNADVKQALEVGDVDVVGGTTWIWTDPDLERSVDVLVVDEAGQLSLADALASARAGSSMILLGDPMQLAQPSQGAHPPGADASALGHVIRAAATIPDDLGLFIEQTRRMHPEIYSFTSEVFYGDRLSGIADLKRQRISTAGTFEGAGLRNVNVSHQGNTNASDEEAENVAGIVRGLAGAQWTDMHGISHTLMPGDILVVTPFNAQIYEIETALRRHSISGVSVGTVDKFQGREAPVVVYSMASSSPDEAPRGMEFLYNLNRLNVATSRARCIACVVCSPELIQVFARTPHQMNLANALCRFVELASSQS
jgi:predicted RecB family nuclease